MQLTSLEWAESYQGLWNEDKIVRKKLRKFSSVFKYAISDRDDIEPVLIQVEKGEIVGFSHDVEAFGKIEFDMWADADNWLKVINQEIGVKRAMMSPGFHFKGPKLKAMTNMGGFERSIELMTQMDGLEV